MASGTENDHQHEAMPKKAASDAAQHDHNDLDNSALDQVAGGMMVAGGAKATVPKKTMTGDPCEGGQ